MFGPEGPAPQLMSPGLGYYQYQTAHLDLFNTVFADPDHFGELMGTEGDKNYALWTPSAHSAYNARAIRIFLPRNVALSPRSLDRLQVMLQALKPLTMSMRIRESGGQRYFELHDEAEENT